MQKRCSWRLLQSYEQEGPVFSPTRAGPAVAAQVSTDILPRPEQILAFHFFQGTFGFFIKSDSPDEVKISPFFSGGISDKLLQKRTYCDTMAKSIDNHGFLDRLTFAQKGEP